MMVNYYSILVSGIRTMRDCAVIWRNILGKYWIRIEFWRNCCVKVLCLCNWVIIIIIQIIKIIWVEVEVKSVVSVIAIVKYNHM